VVGRGRFKQIYKAFDTQIGIDVAWSKICAEPHHLSEQQLADIVGEMTKVGVVWAGVGTGWRGSGAVCCCCCCTHSVVWRGCVAVRTPHQLFVNSSLVVFVGRSPQTAGWRAHHAAHSARCVQL
jgi:hypothetical protein